MANVLLIPLSGSSETIVSYSSVVEIPPRVDCTPGCRDMLIVPCSEVWNCLNPRKGQLYYNPLIAGDKPHIQTFFVDDYNADPENPTNGFGTYIIAELLDIEGNVISADHATFLSRYFVSHNGELSYQTIEISTDLIISNYPTYTCFSIRLKSMNASAEIADELCTNHFYIYTESCNERTLTIESEGANCCGNVFDMPETYIGNVPFRYSTKWRYFAEIYRSNTEFQKQTFGIRQRTAIDLDRIFTLRLGEAIPPYLFAYLTEVSLAGKKVYVNDVEYYIDELSARNEFSSSCDWIGSFELYQSCESKFDC